MKKEGIIYIGFILGAVLIALVVYIGALKGELGLSEVGLSVIALFVLCLYETSPVHRAGEETSSTCGGKPQIKGE